MPDALREPFRGALRESLGRMEPGEKLRTLVCGFLADDAAAEVAAAGKGAEKILVLAPGAASAAKSEVRNSKSEVAGGAIVPLSGDSGKVLAAFPDRSFGWILTLWDPALLAAERLERFFGLLKPGGVILSLVAEDGSPPILDDLVRDLRKGNPDLGVRLAGGGVFPGGPEALRKKLAKAGFSLPRSWRGRFDLAFDGADAALSHLRQAGAETLFGGSKPAAVGRIEAALRRGLESRRGGDGKIRIEHRWLGALAGRPALEIDSFSH